MKPRPFILFTLRLILKACSPAPTAVATAEVPAPVMDGEGYQALQIDDVQVELLAGLAEKQAALA